MLRRQLWIANSIVVIAVLTAAGALAFGALTWWPARGAHHAERPLPPPAAGAFEHGGTPLSDPALALVLEQSLPELVASADEDRQSGAMRSPRRAELVLALLGDPAVTAHGTPFTRAWDDMITGLESWVHVPKSGRSYDAVVTTFKDRVRAVSDQLAAAGLGYYLEGDVITSGTTQHALVYAYRVEQVTFVVAHAEPRRLLELRRLDHLNFAHAMMGMQSEDLGDPVLLLDQIDEHVARKILPVLAPRAAYPLGDDSWGQLDEGRSLRAAAGVAVRGEIAAALGSDAPAAAATGALLAERTAILARWSSDLYRIGWRIPRADTLFLPDGYLAPLAGAVPRYQTDRVATIEDGLARAGAARVALHVQILVANSVRRHEAQHGLDADRDPRLPYPDALGREIGDAEDRAGHPRNFADHCRNELSAYTSQLANDPVTPKTSYFQLVGFAFDRHDWGTPESYAAVVLSEGLAAHLAPGAGAPPQVIHGGEIDRTRLAAIAQLVAAAPPDVLRAAARATWRDFYGEDIAAITDTPIADH
jgi:hypothetical protein